MTIMRCKSELKVSPDNKILQNNLLFTVTLRSVFFLHYSSGCSWSPISLMSFCVSFFLQSFRHLTIWNVCYGKSNINSISPFFFPLWNENHYFWLHSSTNPLALCDVDLHCYGVNFSLPFSPYFPLQEVLLLLPPPLRPRRSSMRQQP